MEPLILLLIAFLILIVVLPFVAIAKANAAKRTVDDLLARLSSVEEALRQSASLAKPGAPVSPSPAIPPPLPVTAPAAVREAPKELEPPPIPQALIDAKERQAAIPIRPPIDWEQFMGAKLFAWIGGLALFLGVAFFVKYSFEHNLIPPELRVAIGFVVGLSLLVGGVLLKREENAVTAQTLCATGILVLYTVTFACRSYYHFAFFGLIPTLLLMTLITAVAFLLAVRLSAIVVAILGLAGGFLTPVLLSTGQDHPLGLFVYIALLDVGLLAVAQRQRWNALPILGAAGTALMQIGWIETFFVPEKYFAGNKVLVVMAVFAGFQALFLAAVAWAKRTGKMNRELSSSALGLAAVAVFSAFYLLPFQTLGQRPALLFSYIFLVDLVALVLAVMAATLLPILAVLLLTLLALGAWLFHIPSELTVLATALFLLGGFAIFFLVAAGWACRRLLAAPGAATAHAPSLFGNIADPANLSIQLPALSATLPFLLLIMVTLRLPLANPSAVFGLALLLTVLLLGMTKIFSLDVLPAVGLVSVVALEYTWHLQHFDPPRATLPLIWYLVFYAVFSVFPFVFHRSFAGKTTPWATAALAGPLHFYLVYQLIRAAHPNGVSGLVPAAFALPSLAGLFMLLTRTPLASPARNAQLALFGGAALFFITLIFPVQFDRQWITVGWALEGAALCWFFHRVPHPGLRVAAVGLLGAVFARLALNPAVLSYHPRAAAPIFNWYLYTYGIATVCLFAAARLLAPPRHLVFGRNSLPLLYTLGTVLAFLLVNIEIADYFSAPGAAALTFQFSGNFARDMSYSIAWGMFALLLLIVGIRKKTAPVRYASLGLLGVTVLKLFFHDLSQLDQLYRIGAFIVVAIIAIVASFLYQRFLPAVDKNHEAKSTIPPTS